MTGHRPPDRRGDAPEGAPDLDARIRSVVDLAPALTVDEIRRTEAPVRPFRRRDETAWRLAVAAALVIVLVGAGIGWRQRNPSPTPFASELVPVPAHPTGPVPAEDTAAAVGDLTGAPEAGWYMARTGGDDRQYVVYFGGGGCGADPSVATETAEAVRIDIHAVDTGQDVCFAIGMDDALAGELAAPLGDRKLTGAVTIASDAVDGQVIDGRELAALAWPPGSPRAQSEYLRPGAALGDFTWTQSFGGVTAPPLRPRVALTQQRGGWLVDGAALVGACGPDGFEADDVDIAGEPGSVVTCRDGTLAVWWMHDGDRLSIVVQPGTAGIDASTIADLARSVRFGG